MDKTERMSRVPSNNVSEKMQILLEQMPLRSNNSQLFDKFIALFISVIIQAKDKEQAVIDGLNENDATNLYDFINKVEGILERKHLQNYYNVALFISERTWGYGESQTIWIRHVL